MTKVFSPIMITKRQRESSSSTTLSDISKSRTKTPRYVDDPSKMIETRKTRNNSSKYTETNIMRQMRSVSNTSEMSYTSNIRDGITQDPVEEEKDHHHDDNDNNNNNSDDDDDSNNNSSPSFQTCLTIRDYDGDESESPAKLNRAYLLQRALSIQELEPSSWLTSSLINLVLAKLANEYKNVRFMPIEFVMLGTSSTKRNVCEDVTDILGQKLNLRDLTIPIIIIFNSQQIHWNLLRVIRSPKPEFQLFEPMGKPVSRHRGLSFRIIPHSVISWLDTCCPLPSGVSWITIGESAITKQQQINSYDCGVACLLYAEKCGQGQTKDQINDETNQHIISEYRKVLQDFTRRMTSDQSSPRTVDLSKEK